MPEESCPGNPSAFEGFLDDGKAQSTFELRERDGRSDEKDRIELPEKGSDPHSTSVSEAPFQTVRV